MAAPLAGGWRAALASKGPGGAGNPCATDADRLAAIVKSRLKSIQYRPALISGFLAQTGLALEPEPP